MATDFVFNPFDRSWWAQPYALYRRILDEAPTGELPVPGLKYFAGFDDCSAILRDGTFGVDERKSTIYAQFGGTANPQRSDDKIRSFLFLDPPDHTRLRAYVARAFTPRVIEGLKANISSTVSELLDRVDSASAFDAITALAYPLPLTVICDLLGIDEADRHIFKQWSTKLVAALDPELVVSEEDLATRQEAIGELRAYMNNLIAERRSHPSEGLVSALANDHADGESDHMSDDELISTLVLLLVAGYETTVNLIGNALLALARHPDQQRALRNQPDKIPGAIEEVLRWDPPVQMTSRVSATDTIIGDTHIAKGDLAILLIAAANRDGRRFVDPDRFDIERADTRHLSFSLGAHHCVGASLARSEAHLAIAQVLARFSDFSLASEPAYRDTLVLRGIESLVLSA